MDTFIKELKLEEIPDGPWKQVAEQIGVENLYTVLRLSLIHISEPTRH